MAKQSPRQQRIVGRVMHEFKEGQLDGSDGRRVRNPKQAIAIALSEAGATRRAAPAETRRELYARAQAADIPGRSRMSRDELARALDRG